MIPSLDSQLTFKCGATMKNRFMLAPLTNKQSHEDGTLSEEEFHWLTMRAKGGFGLVMTCASHVQFIGKGFSGQLGIYDDLQVEGLFIDGGHRPVAFANVFAFPGWQSIGVSSSDVIFVMQGGV